MGHSPTTTTMNRKRKEKMGALSTNTNTSLSISRIASLTKNIEFVHKTRRNEAIYRQRKDRFYGLYMLKRAVYFNQI